MFEYFFGEMITYVLPFVACLSVHKLLHSTVEFVEAVQHMRKLHCLLITSHAGRLSTGVFVSVRLLSHVHLVDGVVMDFRLYTN
jgi:hypothetical protein